MPEECWKEMYVASVSVASLEVSAAGWEEEEIQTLVVTWISCFLLPLPKARRVNVSERRVPSMEAELSSGTRPPTVPTNDHNFLSLVVVGDGRC